jgi:hypothetical protein
MPPIVWALDCRIRAAVNAISASDANPNVTRDPNLTGEKALRFI